MGQTCKDNMSALAESAAVSAAAAAAAATSDAAATTSDKPTGDAAQGKGKGRGVFKAIKSELQAVKQRWDSGVKLFWKRPPPPWPVKLTMTVPKTVCALADPYDLHELKVQLRITGPNLYNLMEGEDVPIEVSVPQKDVPVSLQRAVSSKIRERWEGLLRKELALPEHLRSGSWFLEDMCAWIEASFFELIRLIPECIEMYLGCDEQGVTIRRYAYCEPVSEEQLAREAAEAEAAIAKRKAEAEAKRKAWENRERTPEELEKEERMRQKREARRRERLVKAQQEAQAAEKAAAAARAEAIRRAELGLEPVGKAQGGEKKLTRKERAGQRTSKTAPKAHKSTKAQDRAEAGGKKGAKKKKKS